MTFSFSMCIKALIFNISKPKQFSFLLVCFFTVQLATAQKTNILYIMVDDMGYADLSGYGRKEYKTPHLDKLASQGMKFVNAYSAGAVCTPTRAAFMTGIYPARTTVGLYEPLTGSARDLQVGLTPETPSIAKHLKDAGYRTALIGKWHLGVQPQHNPTKNGFDYFFGFLNGAADYDAHTTLGNVPDLYENETPVSRSGYLTDLFTDKAIDIITSEKEKPFFIALMYNAAHWPWQGPADAAYPDTLDFRQGGSPAIYAAMMASLDNNIKKLMDALEKQGLSDNTLVIFTDDNGGEQYSDQGGFSKRKAALYEGGIRVPAFVRWPGKIKAGSVTDQLAITMDWTATILAVGFPANQSTATGDGLNLLPLLTGKVKTVERTLYWRTSQFNKQKAMRSGNWKYLADSSGEYLFDLRTDPGEKTNLRDSQASLMASLKEKYAAWENSVLAPAP